MDWSGEVTQVTKEKCARSDEDTEPQRQVGWDHHSSAPIMDTEPREAQSLTQCHTAKSTHVHPEPKQTLPQARAGEVGGKGCSPT